MVITRRRALRRSNVRRIYRRSRIPRASSRRRRTYNIMRRMRRSSRPELKFITLNLEDGNVGRNTTVTRNITPVIIEQGVGVGQRIGNQVKTIKAVMRYYIRDNSFQTAPAVAPNIHTGLVRTIIWTPKTDYGQSLNYMATVALLTHIDFNIVKIVRDMVTSISPSYMAEATTNDISAATAPFQRLRTLVIPFPRRITLGPGINSFDEEKQILYMTIISPNLSIAYSFSTKLYYTDA